MNYFGLYQKARAMKTVLRISCLMLSLLMVASAWGMQPSLQIVKNNGYQIVLINGYEEPITVQHVDSDRRLLQKIEVSTGGAAAITIDSYKDDNHLMWLNKSAIKSSQLNLVKHMPLSYKHNGVRYMILEARSESTKKYLDRSGTTPGGWDSLFEFAQKVERTPLISETMMALFDCAVCKVLGDNSQDASQGEDKYRQAYQLPALSLAYPFAADEFQEALLAPEALATQQLLIKNENFEKIALNFINRMKEQLRSSTWVSKKTLLNVQGEVEKKDDVTFVQKKQIPNDAYIKFATDIHGNGQTFFKWLKNLQDEGFLDKSNPFKIIQKNGYIALLGDYVDRGQQGLDVLMGVMLLYLNNPEQVIMLRGNHEYKGMYKQKGGFFDEVDRDETIAARANAIFDLLASACYLTWEDDQRQKQCLLCVHGGPNLGYRPRDLFASSAINCYEVVAHKSIENSTIESALCKQFAKENINVFAWVDFGKKAEYVDRSGRLQLTQDNMLQYFKDSMPGDVRLLAVVRGHQNSPTMTELKFLDKYGVDIFNSKVQFEQPDSEISLDSIQSTPLFITIGSLIEYSDPGCANVDWHKTTLDLILHPELKKSNFVRKAIDTNRKFVDYKIDLQERIKEGMKKFFQE